MVKPLDLKSEFTASNLFSVLRSKAGILNTLAR